MSSEGVGLLTESVWEQSCLEAVSQLQPGDGEEETHRAHSGAPVMGAHRIKPLCMKLC